MKSRVAVLVSCLLLATCGSGGPSGPPLSGGVLAVFEVSGETFKAFVTDPETISEIFALEQGTSQANIPDGRLLRGSGSGGYNSPWSWHMDPEDIEMAELTVEVCDGRPSLVEADLDQWIDVVGRFCPWGAELVAVEDLRE